MPARAAALAIACCALSCARSSPYVQPASDPPDHCAEAKAEALRSPAPPPDMVKPPPGGILLLRAPRVLTEIIAPYPPAARRNRLSGTVIMKVFVRETGDVAQVEVRESAGADFDAAATDALRRFKFQPACSQEGVPIPAWITYSYRFRLP